jgi:hypothetical protein
MYGLAFLGHKTLDCVQLDSEGLIDIKNYNLHREYNFKGEFRYLKT